MNYVPLSLKQLREELGWTQSEVQRTMTRIFGRRPFTIYKQACRQESLGTLLENATNDYPCSDASVEPCVATSD